MGKANIWLVFIGFLWMTNGMAQIKVTGGTSVTIAAGTVVSFTGTSPDTLEVEPNASVVNNGIIYLGDSTIVQEAAGFSIKGAGYEEAARTFSSALTSTNIAGLGAEITTSASLGNTLIRRGHNSFTDAQGNPGILRWYDIRPTNNTGLNVDFTFRYDSSELLNFNPADLYLLQSADSGSTWYNHGRSSYGNYFVTKNSVDSLSMFSLFPVKLTTSPLSMNSLCSGQPVTVPFTIYGQLNSGNYIKAQLSDKTGSFANPLWLDSVITVSSGSITTTLPIIENGSNYRVRVISTDIPLTADDNGADLALSDTLPAAATSPEGDSAICLNTQPATGYSVKKVINAFSYNWVLAPPAAGTIAATADTSISLTWNSAYADSTVTLRVSGVNACGEGTSDSLVVLLKSVPGQPSAISGNVKLCSNKEPVSAYSISSTKGALAHNWSIEPSSAGTVSPVSDTSVIITWNSAYDSTAVVKVSAANNCGEGDSATLAVLVSTCTGIEEYLIDPALTIYPNPAKEVININITAAPESKFSIEIENMLGSTVFKEEVKAHGNYSKAYDVSKLSKGVYVVKARGERTLLTRKFVVE